VLLLTGTKIQLKIHQSHVIDEFLTVSLYQPNEFISRKKGTKIIYFLMLLRFFFANDLAN